MQGGNNLEVDAWTFSFCLRNSGLLLPAGFRDTIYTVTRVIIPSDPIYFPFITLTCCPTFNASPIIDTFTNLFSDWETLRSSSDTLSSRMYSFFFFVEIYPITVICCCHCCCHSHCHCCCRWSFLVYMSSSLLCTLFHFINMPVVGFLAHTLFLACQ